MFSEHFSFDHDDETLQEFQKKLPVVLETVRILQLLLEFLALQPSTAAAVSGRLLDR